jgi:hypothetical protein
MSDSRSHRQKMFDKFTLTESEKLFIEELDRKAFTEDREFRVSEILSNIYLAKQYELASQSSDKSSGRMVALTWAIVFAGSIQAIAAVASVIVALMGAK